MPNSRRQRHVSVLAHVIPYMLHHDRLLGRWAWLALLGFLALEWLGHATGVLVERFGVRTLEVFGFHPKGPLSEALAELALPAAIFGATVA